MLITDHIATGVPNPLIGANLDELGVRFPDMTEVYSKRMRNIIKEVSEKMEIQLREGIYVQLTGPSYETAAEVCMCRSWGGDAVGMSTACEAIAAHHIGMEVCGISCITNLAAGMSSEQLNHSEVQETADRVSKQFKSLVTEIIKNI
jgi:purine-nucleoside phosphorylase